MRTPLVSVCLPNLNTLPYLQERLDTVFTQTYRNWELVVSDNYSEDGAWEFFERIGKMDPRVALTQAPRDGMYANWNNCVRRSRGDYVYMATSDDTMAADCLEKLVDALESRPDCDLAHCTLKVIDEGGHELGPRESHEVMFVESSGSLLDRRHVRFAPYDGLLHLSGRTVYTSMTQLLIRRSLLDRIGLFEARWGSIGDFNWSMRAGLVTNTIHVPDTWGGWRIHRTQATAAVVHDSDEQERKIREMIARAVEVTESALPADMVAALRGAWVHDAQDLRQFMRTMKASTRSVERWAFIMRAMAVGQRSAWRHISARWIAGQSVWPILCEEWAQAAGRRDVLQELTAA